MLARLVRPRPASLGAALLRYRIMAYTVGVWLMVLVFVGMPLQFAGGFDGVVAVVGPLHGFLYIIYLLAALDLARRARFTILEMLAMLGAGLLPLLAFIIERRVTRKVQARISLDQR
jgi:integral membrane protein